MSLSICGTHARRIHACGYLSGTREHLAPLFADHSLGHHERQRRVSSLPASLAGRGAKCARSEATSASAHQGRGDRTQLCFYARVLSQARGQLKRDRDPARDAGRAAIDPGTSQHASQVRAGERRRGARSALPLCRCAALRQRLLPSSESSKLEVRAGGAVR